MERYLDESPLIKEIKEEEGKEASDAVRNYLESYGYSQLKNSIDQNKLSELKKRRRTAQRELDSNLEPSISKSISSKGPQSVSDIREIIRNKTKPDTWEDLPLNQRMTLVAIAHLFEVSPFSQRELREKVESEKASDIFTNCKEIDCGYHILEILRLKGLLNKEGRKRYSLEGRDLTSINIISGYTRETDDISEEKVSFEWMP